MNDILCAYAGDREAALIAYLYDDLPADERAAFDAHLATCARCRTELGAFGAVRRQLAHWKPPNFVGHRSADVSPVVISAESRTANPESRAFPAWAHAVAAVLVLGVAAGIANLHIHYDSTNGLDIRSGWSQKSDVASTAQPTPAANVSPAAGAEPAWRSDLAALERQLRAELRSAQQSAPAPTAVRAAASNDPEVLRHVRTLIEQSERRQQNELALRVAALANEMNMTRQSDLRRIDVSLGRFQDSTGVEVLRNRQKLDYLLQRVTQQQ
jgi:anti-sigma factor RsiW